MNAKELAQRIGVHENTIRNMIRDGRLKAEKKGKSYEVDKEQAQELIIRHLYKLRIAELLGSSEGTIMRKRFEMKEILIKIKKSINEDDEFLVLKYNSDLMTKYLELEKEVIALEKGKKFILEKSKSGEELVINELMKGE